jgi:septation ring formation regulator EzrA
MLLAKHGFERLDILSKRAEEDSVHFRDQLDRTHALLENVEKTLPAEAHLLRNVHSMVTGLYALVCGEMKSSLQHFSQVVSKVWSVHNHEPGMHSC